METTPSTEPKIRVGPQHQVNDKAQPETESTATTEKDIYVRTHNENDTSVRHVHDLHRNVICILDTIISR